ncbi:TNF receptor-associated factor 2-like [Glandiceps talaboti]
MISGYLQSIFGDVEPESKYLCRHCDQILKDPKQTFCGHRYCAYCLEDIISRDSDIRCKACEDEGYEDSMLRSDQIYRDRAILRELNNCSVQCPNDDCDWKGLYKEYDEEHAGSCPSAVITCIKSGCGQRIKRDNLAEHLENDCSMRVEKCQYCEDELLHQELKVHYEECPQYPISCQFCQKAEIPRKMLREHLDTETGDCPKKVVPCNFKGVGCEELVVQDDLKDHSKKHLGEHLVMLMNTMIPFLSMVQKMNDDNGIDDVRVQLGDHDKKIATMTQNAKTFERQLKECQEEMKKKLVVENGLTLNGLKAMYEKLKSGVEDSRDKQTLLQTKQTTYEGLVAVLNKQIDEDGAKIDNLERKERMMTETIEALQRKVKSQDRTIAMKDVALAEQDLRIQSLEMASYDGVLLWKISDFAKKRRDAVSGKTVSMYSPCFYTSRHGYKMCARIYLDGDGMGKGNHISLFFVVMRGPNDALLRWPFRQKVTLMWLDQNNREHVIDAFRPDPTSSSFRRPHHDMNIASGCPLFMPLSKLDSPRHSYVKDDVAFIKIIVDTSDLI